MSIYKAIKNCDYREAAMIADTTAEKFNDIYKYYDDRLDNIDLLKDKIKEFTDFIDEYGNEDIVLGKFYSAGLGIPNNELHSAISSLTDIIPDYIIIERYEALRDTAYGFYRYFIDFADILFTIYEMIDYD